jgi:hypothetical protein
MRDEDYYSVRSGKRSRVKLDLDNLKKLFLSVYTEFKSKDYFYQYLGYWCVDQGNMFGILGDDNSIASRLLLKLGSDELWPLEQYIETYVEDDVFDMIEFLYDCISIPSDGIYHGYNNCGYHDYRTFDKITARKEYQKRVNELLKQYSDGYELSDDGCILILVEGEFDNLLKATVPENIESRPLIQNKINCAIEKYRRGRKVEERRDGIRELADIFELLRPEIKELNLTKDENDIFNLLNNFGIRHFNFNQKISYDTSIFYSAFFYHLLTMIHLVLRLLEKSKIEVKALN